MPTKGIIYQRLDEASNQLEFFAGSHMTSHYSSHDFLRQMPNAHLTHYFAARKVLQDFDCKVMKEANVDVLFELQLVSTR